LRQLTLRSPPEDPREKAELEGVKVLLNKEAEDIRKEYHKLIKHGGGGPSGPLMNIIRNNINLHSRISHKQETKKRIYSGKKLLDSLKPESSFEQKTEGNFLELFMQYYIKYSNTGSVINKKINNKINSRKTMKHRSIKLNTVAPKVSQEFMYSEYQFDLIQNRLLISEASGRINTLYEFYLHTLPNKKYIFAQLLKIPMRAEESTRISQYLQEGNVSELESFLSEHSEKDITIKSEKERIFNELGIRLIVEYYFAFNNDTERFEFLHNLFNNIPDTVKETNELADKFIKTPPGGNPFA
jgi:hypothetical protein